MRRTGSAVAMSSGEMLRSSSQEGTAQGAKGAVRPRSEHCVSSNGRIESIPSTIIGLRYICDGPSHNMDRLGGDIWTEGDISALCSHANGAVIDHIHPTDRSPSVQISPPSLSILWLVPSHMYLRPIMVEGIDSMRPFEHTQCSDRGRTAPSAPCAVTS